MIVVDTNVLSELMREEPDHHVAHWLVTVPSESLSMTAISVMEITYGVARLPAGRRKEAIKARWEGALSSWGGRFLTLGMAESVAAGEVLATRTAAGRPVTASDAQIAGICRVWKASLATRNVGDFDGLGIELVNPWAA